MLNKHEDYLLHNLDSRGKLLQKAFKKENKYGAVAGWCDGIYFKSKKETRRYGYLKRRQQAEEITGLKVHPKYPIEINGIKVCDVELDFEYTENNSQVIEDTKGLDNPMSKLKRKLFEAYYGREVSVL